MSSFMGILAIAIRARKKQCKYITACLLVKFMVCIYHIWPFQRDSGTANFSSLVVFLYVF